MRTSELAQINMLKEKKKVQSTTLSKAQTRGISSLYLLLLGLSLLLYSDVLFLSYRSRLPHFFS